MNPYEVVNPMDLSSLAWVLVFLSVIAYRPMPMVGAVLGFLASIFFIIICQVTDQSVGVVVNCVLLAIHAFNAVMLGRALYERPLNI
jgi:hypothetical protein